MNNKSKKRQRLTPPSHTRSKSRTSVSSDKKENPKKRQRQHLNLEYSPLPFDDLIYSYTDTDRNNWEIMAYTLSRATDIELKTLSYNIYYKIIDHSKLENQVMACRCFDYLYPHVKLSDANMLLYELVCEKTLPIVLQWLFDHNVENKNLHFRFCYRIFPRKSKSKFNGGYSYQEFIDIWELVDIILRNIGGEELFHDNWGMSPKVIFGKDSLAELLMDEKNFQYYYEQTYLNSLDDALTKFNL